METFRKLGFHGELEGRRICPQENHNMGPFAEVYWGEKYCLLFIDEIWGKVFLKTVKNRSEAVAAALELMKKEQRKTQAVLIYKRSNRSKEYKKKVLQDVLRQEKISHKVSERYWSQSNGLDRRLNLTIMDKVFCMLNDATSLSITTRLQMTLMNTQLNFRSSTLRSIFYALQPFQLLHKLQERSGKRFFLVLNLLPTKWRIGKQRCLRSENCKGFQCKVSFYKGKSTSRTSSEEEQCHMSSLDTLPKLENSCDWPRSSKETRSTADLAHTRMLQLQEVGLAATVAKNWGLDGINARRTLKFDQQPNLGLEG